MAQDTPHAAGRKERIIDVRTFLPPDEVLVQLETGKTYPVRSWVDLPIKHALEALGNELADELRPDDLAGSITRAKQTIRLLCPTMPDEDLGALTTRQLIGIARAFYEMSKPEPAEGGPENPPVAGSSSGSASSSLAPPASTAGAIGA